ncbi:hypothetical protein BpHYR1_024102, partial [Brachionus plicatilis]
HRSRNDSSSEDSETSWAVNRLHPGQTLRTSIRVGSTELTMWADTGASTTIIDLASYLSLIPRPVLRSSKAPVYGFNSKSSLGILGEFQTKLVLGNRSAISTVSVVKGNSGCLLSCDDCVTPDVVSLNESKLVRSLNATTKLSINPNIKPVRKKQRHVPHHLRKFMSEKIQKMIEDDVLEPATGPMPWVSPLLALPKPGHNGKAVSEASQIRLVADSTLSNTAIIREHRVTMTPEELAVEANGSDLYS